MEPKTLISLSDKIRMMGEKFLYPKGDAPGNDPAVEAVVTFAKEVLQRYFSGGLDNTHWDIEKIGSDIDHGEYCSLCDTEIYRFLNLKVCHRCSNLADDNILTAIYERHEQNQPLNNGGRKKGDPDYRRHPWKGIRIQESKELFESYQGKEVEVRLGDWVYNPEIYDRVLRHLVVSGVVTEARAMGGGWWGVVIQLHIPREDVEVVHNTKYGHHVWCHEWIHRYHGFDIYTDDNQRYEGNRPYEAIDTERFIVEVGWAGRDDIWEVEPAELVCAQKG